MKNELDLLKHDNDSDEPEDELQNDHGVPFINTSVSETKPIFSPEEADEESVIGSMTNPEADDDVDEFGKPFGKRPGE